MRTSSLAAFVSISLSAGAIAFAADAATPAAPRAARSVHLGWQAPAGELFYNEMAVEQSVPGSYFMAAGWNTGYFGIQEISPGKKVVIFSVWDPTKGDNPNSVPNEERVELLHQDADVRIKRFGGEGTGGQCMWTYDWKLKETYRFCLRGTVTGEKTSYAAYFYLPEEKRWKHLATFRTRTGGTPLTGYYSFVEDFRRDTKSVAQTRRARFGNGWVKAVAGDWVPLRKARFSASGASWESKDNIDAGLADSGFFLATGGDIKASTKLGGELTQSSGEANAPGDLPDAGGGK
jgi:hypothetical protein